MRSHSKILQERENQNMNFMNYGYDRQSLDGSLNIIPFSPQQKNYENNENIDMMIKISGQPTDSNQSTGNSNSAGFSMHSQMNGYQYYNQKSNSNAQDHSGNNIWQDKAAGVHGNDANSSINTIETANTSISATGNINGSKKGFLNSSIHDRNISNVYETYSNTSDDKNSDQFDSFSDLKLTLQVKEAQIESLEAEIQKFKSIFNQGLQYKQQENKYEKKNSLIPSVVEIPSTLEHVFKKLSTALQDKERELVETKGNLESILTALALDPNNSTTKYGRYDVEALSHKMIVRIETLTAENQEMSKMIAYGRSKETEIELQLFKKENNELKEQIRFIQQQIQKNNKQKFSR